MPGRHVDNVISKVDDIDMMVSNRITLRTSGEHQLK
jgi:hypothetical protein